MLWGWQQTNKLPRSSAWHLVCSTKHVERYNMGSPSLFFNFFLHQPLLHPSFPHPLSYSSRPENFDSVRLRPSRFAAFLAPSLSAARVCLSRLCCTPQSYATSQFRAASLSPRTFAPLPCLRLHIPGSSRPITSHCTSSLLPLPSRYRTELSVLSTTSYISDDI